MTAGAVASDIKWGIGGEKEGDIGALTEELVVSRPARIRVQIHTPKGSIGPPCIADPRRARCSAICSLVLVVALSLARRRRRPLLDAPVDALAADDAAALAPMPSSLQTPSHSQLLPPPVCLSRSHRRHTCVSRTRAHA